MPFPLGNTAFSERMKVPSRSDKSHTVHSRYTENILLNT